MRWLSMVHRTKCRATTSDTMLEGTLNIERHTTVLVTSKATIRSREVTDTSLRAGDIVIRVGFGLWGTGEPNS